MRGESIMPHVTFIHGIANKPPKDKLLADWEAYLALGGLDLAAEGVTTSMVYWADMLYAAPLAAADDFESVDNGLGTSEIDEDMGWVDDLPADEKAFVESFSEKLNFDASSPNGDDFTPAIPTSEDDLESLSFEAIPLPWFIKRRAMKILLKDVHHYLFNASFSPRPGDVYQIQDNIRNLFVDQLKKDATDNQGKHIVVSHSMGTVISYDCLKNVPGCPAIDSYMTVGCPLGISEVFDNFDPKYTSNNAFPSEKVSGDWVNVYDRLDPVAFDARISNDYRKNGAEVITDQRVHNSGMWRHSGHKYFGQQLLCNHLRTLLT